MCQLNSEPMMSQTGFLDVLGAFPPHFLSHPSHHCLSPDNSASHDRGGRDELGRGGGGARQSVAAMQCAGLPDAQHYVEAGGRPGTELGIVRGQEIGRYPPRHAQLHAPDSIDASVTASKFEGEFLNISQVTRDDMAAYLCIISNSVPPSISKRISIQVNCKFTPDLHTFASIDPI